MYKSKPIKKADDDAKELIIELLAGKNTGGFDLDSIYIIEDRYFVIEFLKCETVRPHKSHPNRYWFKNSQKFLSLWKITQKLEGRLFLLNYEETREQFLLIEVLNLDNLGIKKEIKKELNFQQIQSWFQDLNKKALNS
tara:strand:+ start:43 stop:456 length:414 start_codon:yes stop_codon:yes gene_type:complete